MPARSAAKGTAKGKKKKTVAEIFEKLLDDAEMYAANLQPDLALRSFEKAMKIAPDNIRLMDMFAQFLLDVDDFERAFKLLSRSITIAPEEGYAKYFMMAQLLKGHQALESYNRGIRLLTKEIQQVESERGDASGLREEMSLALSAASELFMTDLCDEDDAETQCEKYLQEAITACSTNAEVLQTMASLKISQQNNEEALDFLNKSYSLWRSLPYEDRPSLEFCHNTAKLFLDLDQPRIAARIWEKLVDVDKNIAELFYHLGLAYQYISSSTAMEAFARAKELLEEVECKDAELLKLVDGMIEKVSKETVELEMDPESDDEAGEDIEWVEDEDYADDGDGKSEMDV